MELEKKIKEVFSLIRTDENIVSCFYKKPSTLTARITQTFPESPP